MVVVPSSLALDLVVKAMLIAFAVVIATAIGAACVVHTPVPQARVRLGPAAKAPPKRILALPATCQTAGLESETDERSASICSDGQGLAVDVLVRGALEFSGLRIVDSEVVNAYLRERVTTQTNGQRTESVSDEAATWATTNIERQRELLGELGVDGYLTAEISVGNVRNLEGQRTITVAVTVSRASDGANRLDQSLLC